MFAADEATLGSLEDRMAETRQDKKLLSDDDEDVEQIIQLGQALIHAILEGQPTSAIQVIIDAGAPLWFQDDDGWSPLHAAASVQNDALMQLLLEEGAVWNQTDNLGNTAGDIALSLDNEPCYRRIRDAGIRSELLLQLLSSRGGFEGDSLVLKSTDTSAFASTDAFLSSKLRYTKDKNGQAICLLESEGNEVGVMMGWEREIMQETVRRLCADREDSAGGPKVLNVGFGLGIIDTFFQGLPTPPSLHVIIEPHPDVLQYMRSEGWYEKAGVKILEGKWQDFIESDALMGLGGFDAVYTDTFSEDYEALNRFFAHVPKLLAGPSSRFSFFNGLGATNAVFYDVYTRLSELHLSDLGIDVEWEDVDVAEAQGVDRWGKTREYFAMRLYRLPIGKRNVST
ncbi:hypothetical protein FA95DRAFT_1659148 [Auriscalpium vulgare]|uniref:Uncharacterized protein n=1 Tax=Auriscalpium vulgare TaxID=40419 RepID=A0ACB8R4U0_9AGAM|nr:hypothetical protein FA95DRAFT_1659148 [Auriscalpium vulgare]